MKEEYLVSFTETELQAIWENAISTYEMGKNPVDKRIYLKLEEIAKQFNLTFISEFK